MLGVSPCCWMSSICIGPEFVNPIEIVGSDGSPRYTEPVCAISRIVYQGPTPSPSHAAIASSRSRTT